MSKKTFNSWTKVLLGEIAKLSSGGTPSRSVPAYWNGTIPWVTTTKINFETILDADEYITPLGLKNSSTKIFPQGTLLMAMYGQGATRGRVGFLGIDAAVNQACACIEPAKDVSANYLFYYLEPISKPHTFANK